MNKYPQWKYLLILVIVLLGAVYALPNIFGTDPAIQISASRSQNIDAGTLERIKRLLDRKKISYRSVMLDDKGIKVRFSDTEVQLLSRDLIQRDLGDRFTVALNLLPATPDWLASINGKPMYLGLDLRGGVHFLMQMDMEAVLSKAEQSYASELRSMMRKEKIRYLTVSRRGGGGLRVRFRNDAERQKASNLIGGELSELKLTEVKGDRSFDLVIALSEEALREKHKLALEQNMTSLRNRVNELGVAEPIIQQQGHERIVVQLPGVQDTAKAKEILGRTATLEIKLVDEQHDLQAALAGRIPPGSRIYHYRDGRPILIKNRLIYSGDNIIDAAPGFDSRSSSPIVSITLDSRGAAINQRVTGKNINKRMAVIYLELRSTVKVDDQGNPVLDKEGRPVRIKERIEEVITAPVIRSQLGKRYQIEGLDSMEEANDISLLLRAGALAAPISIVEERTIGPSLGADNIRQGFQSIMIGFVAILIFMVVYYRLFGLFANVALTLNLVLIVAALSLFQATLTLPGVA
ncbi:MAG: protein translocase subunit SecD, partial [Acidiferrobacterales bacterium]